MPINVVYGGKRNLLKKSRLGGAYRRLKKTNFIRKKTHCILELNRRKYGRKNTLSKKAAPSAG
jgi:hypothetical protein